MTLAKFGVDPDEPETEETVYEFETIAGSWELQRPTVDESTTPAKTRCPGCGYNIGPENPVLLDYGRDDDFLVACYICDDCRIIIPTQTASDNDDLGRCCLSPHVYLRLYKRSRVLDGEYPNWELYQLDLDGDLPGGNDDE